MVDYNGLVELVKKRRSIRKFKPDKVPDELINKILDVARQAPSGANHQPWEFVVVKDPITKSKITEIILDALRVNKKLELTREKDLQHPNASRPVEELGFRGAPVFIFVLGDPRTRQAQILAAQQGNESYISSLANAFIYMHLAAASMGLGSQWLSACHGILPQALIKQELGIPAAFNIYDMFVLGYPDHSPKPRKIRELKEMVHQERYDMTKFRTDAEVKKFSREIQLGHNIFAGKE